MFEFEQLMGWLIITQVLVLLIPPAAIALMEAREGRRMARAPVVPIRADDRRDVGRPRRAA